VTFTPEIYQAIDVGCERSAAVIVPLVYDLIRPESVIDVGCGTARFARAFAALGCATAAVDESVEEGERDGVAFFRRTLPTDLASIHAPGQPFDLALCLEVGEHLLETVSEALVASLAACAPLVLWSAAIPGQSGHGHSTLRWPSWWGDLFARHGFVANDDLRWEIWDDQRIECWYRQNLLLFGRRDWFEERGMAWTERPRSVVHPDIWAWKA
jgi:SAM-dependent methyltransferase